MGRIFGEDAFEVVFLAIGTAPSRGNDPISPLPACDPTEVSLCGRIDSSLLHLWFDVAPLPANPLPSNVVPPPIGSG